MSGHTQDMQVAVADLEGEQDVEPPKRERAVDVEEVDCEHAGRLGAQELPPAGVGVSRQRPSRKRPLVPTKQRIDEISIRIVRRTSSRVRVTIDMLASMLWRETHRALPLWELPAIPPGSSG